MSGSPKCTEKIYWAETVGGNFYHMLFCTRGSIHHPSEGKCFPFLGMNFVSSGTRMLFTFVVARQWSCGKVMFSYVVSLSVHRGRGCPCDTINHDALDLTVQPPAPDIRHGTCDRHPVTSGRDLFKLVHLRTPLPTGTDIW